MNPSLWPKCVRWERVMDLPQPGRPYTTNLNITCCTVLYCTVLYTVHHEPDRGPL